MSDRTKHRHEAASHERAWGLARMQKATHFLPSRIELREFIEHIGDCVSYVTTGSDDEGRWAENRQRLVPAFTIHAGFADAN